MVQIRLSRSSIALGLIAVLVPALVVAFVRYNQSGNHTAVTTTVSSAATSPKTSTAKPNKKLRRATVPKRGSIAHKPKVKKAVVVHWPSQPKVIHPRIPARQVPVARPVVQPVTPALQPDLAPIVTKPVTTKPVVKPKPKPQYQWVAPPPSG
jgi:hypothetical protein